MSVYDLVVESVPHYLRRVGDSVLQGSNNSVIVLGTDRATRGVAKPSAGLGHAEAPRGGTGAGSIHMVVGRKDAEGNPDFTNDSSYVYMSMRSDVDPVVGTTMEGSQRDSSVIAMRTDCARLVVRKDLKISFDGGDSYLVLSQDAITMRVKGSGVVKLGGGKIVVDGDNIQLGENAVSKLVKGTEFMQLFNSHFHSTAVGPTSPPTVPMLDAVHLSARTVRVA